MIVMIARKQYVYQYMEEMLTDIKFVETGESCGSFVQLAGELDYLVVGRGSFEPNEKISPVLTIQEFADLYFKIEKNSESESEFTKRCDLIRNYLQLHFEN